MTKLRKYKKLLLKNYDEAVKVLLEKYGPAKNDYFREVSYINFLKGCAGNINMAKYTRTSEGLWCHHIDEIQYPNLSNKNTIKTKKYPFDLQKKDRLVYCDLFEHAILHVLIAKETVFKCGFRGYNNFLSTDIKRLYIDEIEPTKQWEKNCFKKAYLKPEEACMMMTCMFKVLNEEFSKHPKGKIHDYEYVKKNLNHGPLLSKGRLKHNKSTFC